MAEPFYIPTRKRWELQFLHILFHTFYFFLIVAILVDTRWYLIVALICISLISKGDQSWVFLGRTDAEAETPILWPPHVKSWLIGKDSDAGRD